MPSVQRQPLAEDTQRLESQLAAQVQAQETFIQNGGLKLLNNFSFGPAVTSNEDPNALDQGNVAIG